MGTNCVVWVFGAIIGLAVPHRAAAAPICQDVPASPGDVTDTLGLGTPLIATGEATIMSETLEGLALAEDAARLEAKAALHADRRVPKVGDGQLRGILDLGVCRNQDKIFVKVTWGLESARQAAEVSAAMSRNQAATMDLQAVQTPGVDRALFDRLMH